MMLALILAQLVLPWPGLDSPLVQPGPTICVGACAGPVVWGPAEQRGRLVVACDMTSDTCSDGRKITTTRATPVPCEVAPGQWEMVPADQGCYSVRGLESWAANTSYLSFGAELDRSPWIVDAQASIEALPGGGYRVCHSDPAAGNHGLRQLLGGSRPETLTVAAIARANTAPSALIGAWSQFETPTLPASWGLVAATKQTASGASGQTFFYPRPAGQGRCIDLLATWLTHTATPGRPCWGGEAPVTCGADVTGISTEGWPTEAGEVCVTVTLGEDAPSPAVILDGRASSGDVGTVLYHQASGLRWKTGSTELVAPAPQRGQPSSVCAGRSGGRLYVRVNGAHHEGPEAPALSWEPTARLGHGRVTSQVINGSISSLRVRSFE